MQSIEFLAVRQLFGEHDFADLIFDGYYCNSGSASTCLALGGCVCGIRSSFFPFKRFTGFDS
jgi:hypothetical protein